MKITVQQGIDARQFQGLMYEIGMVATGVTVQAARQLAQDRAKLLGRQETSSAPQKPVQGDLFGGNES